MILDGHNGDNWWLQMLNANTALPLLTLVIMMVTVVFGIMASCFQLEPNHYDQHCCNHHHSDMDDSGRFWFLLSWWWWCCGWSSSWWGLEWEITMVTCFPDSVCPALEVRRRGHDTGRGRLQRWWWWWQRWWCWWWWCWWWWWGWWWWSGRGLTTKYSSFFANIVHHHN